MTYELNAHIELIGLRESRLNAIVDVRTINQLKLLLEYIIPYLVIFNHSFYLDYTYLSTGC